MQRCMASYSPRGPNNYCWRHSMDVKAAHSDTGRQTLHLIHLLCSYRSCSDCSDCSDCSCCSYCSYCPYCSYYSYCSCCSCCSYYSCPCCSYHSHWNDPAGRFAARWGALLALSGYWVTLKSWMDCELRDPCLYSW